MTPSTSLEKEIVANPDNSVPTNKILKIVFLGMIFVFVVLGFLWFQKYLKSNITSSRLVVVQEKNLTGRYIQSQDGAYLQLASYPPDAMFGTVNTSGEIQDRVNTLSRTPLGLSDLGKIKFVFRKAGYLSVTGEVNLIAGSVTTIFAYLKEDMSRRNECLDTDSGVNIFVKGKTKGNNDLYFSEDTCLNNTRLYEHSCDINKKITTNINCENGCKDGACIEMINESFSSGGNFSPSSNEEG